MNHSTLIHSNTFNKKEKYSNLRVCLVHFGIFFLYIRVFVLRKIIGQLKIFFYSIKNKIILRVFISFLFYKIFSQKFFTNQTDL